MRNFTDSIIGRLIGLFKKEYDPRIIDAINIENLRSENRFSRIIIILESVSLALYVIFNMNNERLWSSFLNASCCIVACVIVVAISGRYISKYDRSGVISDKEVSALTYFFYVLLSLWGVFVDVAHYEAGEQMFTFYIVQFCFICFVLMKPGIGSALIAGSFVILFWNLYMVDGAVGIQLPNFVIFMAIAILGNAIKYSLTREYERDNLKIRELNKILEKEAVVDELTKLKNRKALRLDMEKYIGQHICVIMSDIDHFKNFNDTYGHNVGDKVLSRVAASIRDVFKGCDNYRYGGDEFLVIITGRTDDECRERIRRWKSALEDIKITDAEFPITCSSGCSCDTVDSKETFRACLKKADDRMYEEKNKATGC